MNLATYLHSVSNLRMRDALSPLFRTSSWHAKEPIYVYLHRAILVYYSPTKLFGFSLEILVTKKYKQYAKQGCFR